MKWTLIIPLRGERFLSRELDKHKVFVKQLENLRNAAPEFIISINASFCFVNAIENFSIIPKEKMVT
jgi:hypothetical protein